MAIDKSRTSPFVKVVIIALALTFVVSVGGVAIVPLLQSLTAAGKGTPNSGLGSNNTSETIAAIAAKYAGRINAGDTTLKTDPKNYDVLLSMARSYQDWGTELIQLSQKMGGSDLPLFLKSVGYYKQALAVKPGDPAVATDMAIAQFYSGDAPGAIATAEGVIKKDPKFAPAHFNLGIFYGQTGDNARAVSELQTSLSLDPKGASAQSAKQLIAEFQQKAGTSSPPPGSVPASQ